MKLLQLITDHNEIQFNIHFYASCLNCSLSKQLLRNGEHVAHQPTLKCKNASTLTAFLRGVVTWSCESFNSVQGKQQSNACTRTIIQYNVSEILGSLDFLPFSLPELTTSPIICCIAVASGQESDSETELGPCSPKLTAATA